MSGILTKETAEVVASVGSNRLKEFFLSWKNEHLSLKSMRSWSAFCDKTKFSLPKIADTLSRFKSNLLYWQTNYVVIFLILVIYCIITNPWFLLIVGLCGGMWGYIFHWKKDPIKLGNYEVTERQKTIILSVVTALLFYLASVGNTIFWLLGASITVVVFHALFYIPTEESEYDTMFNASFDQQQQPPV